MGKTTIKLLIVMLLSKGLAFIKDIIITYYYGADFITDAYIISNTIPVVLISIVMMSITTGYIPIYNTITEKYNKLRANEFTSVLITFLMVISSLIVILVLLFTDKIVSIFSTNFDVNELGLLVKFTRISIFGIYFTVLNTIYSDLLKTDRIYIIPTLVGISTNVIIVIFIIVSYYFGSYFLVIGTIIGLFLQFILLSYVLKNKGYKLKVSWNFKDEYLKSLLILTVPLIIGVAVNEINIIIDKVLASNISVGGITILTYGNKINVLIQSIFIIPIITITFPELSKMAAKSDSDAFSRTIMKSINFIVILLVPISMGFLIFHKELIVFIYARGAFDSKAVELTSSVALFYSLGLLGYGIRDVLSRAFYALHDTKTPMLNGSLSVVINVVLNFILSFYMGLNGLALATSISVLVCSILLCISLRKKIGPFGMKQISISFIKIFLASLVMGGLAKLSFNYLAAYLSQNLSLILAIVVGAVSYFVMIYFMKIEDADLIVGALKKKLGRGTI